MSSSDWEIFFRFSSRIRSLSPFLYTALDQITLLLGIDVIIALSRPPSHGPLVPNLRTLHWTESDEKYKPLLQSLLTRSLVDLSLPSFSLRSPEMSMDLITRCPLLKNLCIWGSLISVEGQEISSGAFAHLFSLESFECDALNEVAIVSLSKFPSLVKLSGRLQNNLELGRVRPYLTSPTFPSLVSLKLKLGGDNGLSTLTSLLEVMRFCPQEVSFTLDVSPTPDMVYLFFVALINSCDSKRLSHISLIVPVSDTLGVNRPQISLFTFRPLLALPNMKSFTLNVRCNIFLDDGAIDALTRYWPKITKLSINASFGWGIPSKVTHWGLVVLLSRCTSLVDFALAVDFTEVDTPPSLIPRSRLGDRITSYCQHADFVTSAIKYPASIAAFLSDIYPVLCGVTSFWSEDQIEAEEFEKKWEQVDEILPGFLAVRSQYTGMN